MLFRSILGHKVLAVLLGRTDHGIEPYLSLIHISTYVAAKCETISYMFFSPVFFASIGAKVVLPEMSASIVLFSLLLIAVAVITKVIGCGLGLSLIHI